jgi:hypothetical protein
LNRFVILVMLVSFFYIEKSYSIQKRFNKLINEGNYKKIIELTKNPKNSIDYFYHAKGFSELKNYKKAQFYFENSLRLGSKRKDIFYELGQVYFAKGEDKKAYISFNKSIKNQYKISASLYYNALILSRRKQYFQSAKQFNIIMKRDYSPMLMKQSASFQIAENYYEETKMYKKDIKSLLNKYVFPQYLKAFQFDEDTLVASLVKNRVLEIREEHGLIENNIILKTKKKNKIKLVLDSMTGYDSNVSRIDPEYYIAPVNKSSIKNTNAISTFFKRKVYDMHSELILKLKNDIYFNRKEDLIKEYNNVSTNLTWRNSYPTQAIDFLSSFILEINFEHSLREIYSDAKLTNAGNNYSLAAGQKLLNESGDKYQIKGQIKQNNSYDTLFNFKTYSFNYEQLNQINELSHIGLLSLNLDFNLYDNKENLLNTYNYMVRLDYIMPKFLYEKFDVGFSLTGMLTDPVKLRTQRGLETTLIPEVKLGLQYSNNLSLEFMYNYETRKSKDKSSYSFSKHFVGANIKYQMETKF